MRAAGRSAAAGHLRASPWSFPLRPVIQAAESAEADGKRPRQPRGARLTGFEDRGGHQAPRRLQGLTLPAPGSSPPSEWWRTRPGWPSGVLGPGTRLAVWVVRVVSG